MLLAASALSAQVTVPSGKKTQIPAPDATSAVSLDEHIAAASIENGTVTIKGLDPGDTLVIVVNPSGMRQIAVHISAGSPNFPPGFVAPSDNGNNGGSYEVRFNSDRLQVENVLDLHSQNPGETTQVHVVTSSFAQDALGTTFVPSAYYRFATPGVDATLLDQNVKDSPLTFQDVVLRGLHIKVGDWTFHGGYTASASFADVFLPTQKEFAAGLTRRGSRDHIVSVDPGLYFMHSIDLRTGLERSSLFGALLFTIRLVPTWHLQAEAADNGKLAYAGELSHEKGGNRFDVKMMERRADFPALQTSPLPGFHADASWTEIFGKRLSLVSETTLDRVDLSTLSQNMTSSFANLHYKFSKSWTASTGVSYGSFASSGALPTKTLSLPQQISYDRTHFGAGFQYQFSTVSDSFSNGSGIRENLRLNLGRFQIGQFLDYQKDAISVSSLTSRLPGVQLALDRLGLIATTPGEVASLLEESALLHALGAASTAQIETVPRRLQEGGNLTWISSGARPHQLSISVIASDDRFSTSNVSSYNVTGTYSKEVGYGNLLLLNGSVVQSGTGTAGQQTINPLVAVSFRHTFSRQTGMFAAPKTAAISGTVFVDLPRQGTYYPGMPTVPRVAVVLDGQRTVLTDAAGHFRFGGISTGDHRVEVRFNSDREHYFTTPQDAIVAGGSKLDFGIAFPKTDLWGYVQDDAGNGLPNVKLQITSSAGPQPITTTASGKFILPDVQPGTYRIQVNPESVPSGYSAEHLADVEVTMSGGAVSHPVIKIPAIRVLIGTVRIYDATAEDYVPVKGAIISIAQLGVSVLTNAAGRFSIGDLPPGNFELKVAAGKSSVVQAIEVPVRPATLRSDFRISSLDGQITPAVVGSRE